jgi:3-oxoacyl-[acyl-carrier protein] reductase
MERVAVVTGTSTGIGVAICEQMLAQGFQVLALARRKTPIDHPKLVSVEVDLGDRAAIAQASDHIAATYKVTDIVHNAGVLRHALIEDWKIDDIDHLVNLHLVAAIDLVRANLETMKAQKFGRIVLVSSRAALGLQGRTSYSATKAGQIGMARTWALELSPHGITTNVIAPGPISTPMLTDVIPEESEKYAQIAAQLPVRRMGQPDDVANAVMFFLKPESGFITGQTLYVCGGLSVGTLFL